MRAAARSAFLELTWQWTELGTLGQSSVCFDADPASDGLHGLGCIRLVDRGGLREVVPILARRVGE